MYDLFPPPRYGSLSPRLSLFLVKFMLSINCTQRDRVTRLRGRRRRGSLAHRASWWIYDLCFVPRRSFSGFQLVLLSMQCSSSCMMCLKGWKRLWALKVCLFRKEHLLEAKTDEIIKAELWAELSLCQSSKVVGYHLYLPDSCRLYMPKGKKTNKQTKQKSE